MYLASSRTHENHETWMVDSCTFFYMTPYKEWFYEYEGMMEVMFS
jgi:hypothetical protein